MRQRYGYWLAGQEADEGAWLEVRDKFTGDPLTEVATASPATIERAIQAAGGARAPPPPPARTAPPPPAARRATAAPSSITAWSAFASGRTSSLTRSAARLGSPSATAEARSLA